MTNLITQPSNTLEFMFEGHEVRVIRDEQGEPWFVAKDVAETLGYVRARDAISQHCKGAVKHRLLTSGGEQELTIIPERDVYRLVMRSKLEGAEQFEEWVVGEVLPSIRKTGSYNVRPLTTIEMFALSAQALTELEQRTKEVEKQQQQVQQSLAQQKSKLLQIDNKITAGLEEIKETNLLTSCPSAAESITGIRLRMNKEYGLSASVVDAVMRQSLYAPKPIGMVRNQHESSGGSTYAVYWKKDVSNVFKMFVGECICVSPVYFTHQFVAGKFKLNK